MSLMTAMTNSTAVEKLLLNGVDLVSTQTSKTPSEDEHMALPDKLTTPTVMNTTDDMQTNGEVDENRTGVEVKHSYDSGVTDIAEKRGMKRVTQ